MARREAVVTAAARWVLLESIALITSSVIINESRLLLEKQIVKSFTKQRAGKVGGCEQERSTPQCKFNNCGMFSCHLFSVRTSFVRILVLAVAR